MHRAPTIAFATLFLLSVAQAAWQHGRLPETVATHFDALGRPDAWGPRSTLTAWHLGTVLFMAAMLEGIARIGRRIPAELINLPHREHWLAPERRDATFTRLSGMVRLLGSVVLAFLIGLFHLVYRANTGAGSLTAIMVLLVVAVLASLAIILGTFVLRFVRRPAA